jgi:mannose-1-phosphate guanylyltransferase
VEGKELIKLKAVILAGGKGTRMRPITYLNPKPMLPLIDKPFMENFIFWIKSHGIKDIILSTGYLPDIFEEYFGNGSSMDLNLTYVTEKLPLGTCGAVKNVEKYLGNSSFMVFNGDILTSMDLKEMMAFHKSKKADITIALTPVEDPTAYGLVPIDKDYRVKEFLEKPSLEEINTNLINAGTYIIEPKLLDLMPRGESYSFERELFPKALKLGYRIYGFVSNAYWLDVGTPEKYLTAHYDILDKKIGFKFIYKKILQNIFIGENVKFTKDNFMMGPLAVGDGTIIEKGAKILPLTVLGRNCHVSSGASISGSIIFDGCSIGKNCIIKKSILSKNVKVASNVKIEDNSIIGDNTIVGENNILKNGIRININSKILPEEILF